MVAGGSVALLLRLAGATSFALAIYYEACVLHLPESVRPKAENYGGLARFLTFLNISVVELHYFVSSYME